MVMRGTQALEVWARRVTSGYRGVRLVNMTSAWRDGLAFCAILHRYRPDLIDYHALDPTQVEANCRLVFGLAEKELGIPSLLDPKDMAACHSPDRLSILTYLSEFYHKFADASPQPAPRKSTTGKPGVERKNSTDSGIDNLSISVDSGSCATDSSSSSASPGISSKASSPLPGFLTSDHKLSSSGDSTFGSLSNLSLASCQSGTGWPRLKTSPSLSSLNAPLSRRNSPRLSASSFCLFENSPINVHELAPKARPSRRSRESQHAEGQSRRVSSRCNETKRKSKRHKDTVDDCFHDRLKPLKESESPRVSANDAKCESNFESSASTSVVLRRDKVPSAGPKSRVRPRGGVQSLYLDDREVEKIDIYAKNGLSHRSRQSVNQNGESPFQAALKKFTRLAEESSLARNSVSHFGTLERPRKHSLCDAGESNFCGSLGNISIEGSRRYSNRESSQLDLQLRRSRLIARFSSQEDMKAIKHHSLVKQEASSSKQGKEKGKVSVITPSLQPTQAIPPQKSKQSEENPVAPLPNGSQKLDLKKDNPAKVSKSQVDCDTQTDESLFDPMPEMCWQGQPDGGQFVNSLVGHHVTSAPVDQGYGRPPYYGLDNNTFMLTGYVGHSTLV